MGVEVNALAPGPTQAIVQADLFRYDKTQGVVKAVGKRMYVNLAPSFALLFQRWGKAGPPDIAAQLGTAFESTASALTLAFRTKSC